MDRLTSIPIVTLPGDSIVLVGIGIKTDPVRVLLMSENDHTRMIVEGANIDFESEAMPLLSVATPKTVIRPPTAGRWRIVYQTGDAESIVAAAIS